MVCRTYDSRHVRRSKTDLPRFDKYFKGDEYFVRPARKDQVKPWVPSDITTNDAHYVVEKLDGLLVAVLCGKTPEEVFKEDGNSVFTWMH